MNILLDSLGSLGYIIVACISEASRSSPKQIEINKE